MNKTDSILAHIKPLLNNLIDGHISFTKNNTKDNTGMLHLSLTGFKIIDSKYFVFEKYYKPNFSFIWGLFISDSDIIFIAENYTATLKREMKDNGISYIEANGNMHIKKENIFIYVETNKKVEIKKAKSNRAFSTTGLKIIFSYLTTSDIVNMSVRDLGANLGIPYTNFHYVNHGLKELKYLVNINQNTLQLTNKKELIERWIFNFEEKLKPKLFIGKFRFLDAADYENWKKVNLQNGDTEWSGEPAAAILTNQISPQIFTLYTSLSKTQLAKQYKMIPDDNGYIFGYKQFYSHLHIRYDKIVNPLLVYADLKLSGESRNIKIAQGIYESYLQN
jgi:hypothetical protein